MTWVELILPEPEGRTATVRRATSGPFEVCWVCLSSPARAGGEDSAFLRAEGDDQLMGFAIDGMGGMARGAEAAQVAATHTRTRARPLPRAGVSDPEGRSGRAAGPRTGHPALPGRRRHHRRGGLLRGRGPDTSRRRRGGPRLQRRRSLSAPHTGALSRGARATEGSHGRGTGPRSPREAPGLQRAWCRTHVASSRAPPRPWRG